jgi:hypothetical protein
VSVANSTAASTGPMVAKKVVKLVSAISSIGCLSEQQCGAPLAQLPGIYQQSS